MKILPAVLSVTLFILIAFLTYAMDQWLGVAAFTMPYLLFCMLIALIVGAAWMPLLEKRACVAALAAFCLLSLVAFLNQPAERVLRSAMIRMPARTNADLIEGIVARQYEGTGYTMPQITREAERVDVSLANQEPGNSTGLIIHIKNGKVTGSVFVPD